jgi:hypothetical protein
MRNLMIVCVAMAGLTVPASAQYYDNRNNTHGGYETRSNSGTYQAAPTYRSNGAYRGEHQRKPTRQYDNYHNRETYTPPPANYDRGSRY